MHGFGYEKLAAARAIKDVVEKGSIIKIEKNYNKTQVDRYFIAGMGHIDNYPAFLGLIIKAYPTQKNSNAKFYLHETVIIKTDSPIMTAPQLSVDTVSESVYNNSISNPSPNVKRKQLEIIEKVNPAPNSYLTWIRKVEDIKTLSETLEDSDWSDYDEFNPDLTRGMIEDAIEKGEITVYSSYQIKQGTFVSPSYMEAESYSGNGKVYEKTVKIDDVAWIDPTQGMYANINEKYSDRDPDALTPRNLLANALEESAVHEVEKKKLAEYKDNIEKLYAKEQELYEVRKEIKELSFSTGKRDTAKLKKLQDRAIGLF